MDDQIPQPNEFLIDLLIQSATLAPSIDVSSLQERSRSDEERIWMDTWPGEHYKLLPAIAKVLQAERVIEVGTYLGQGTLALRLGARHVTTYDIFSYDTFPNSTLQRADFENGIEQRVCDLSDPRVFDQELDTLMKADFIFVDAPKDGAFERAFAELLYPAIRGSGKVVMWDDIRVMAMVDFWRWLPAAKLDATSFGHWSGTGLTQA